MKKISRRNGQPVMSVVLTMLNTGLLLIISSTATLGNCNYKLQIVASESAKNINQGRYWLGMQRPEGTVAGSWEREPAELDAKALASTTKVVTQHSYVSNAIKTEDTQ